MPGSRAGRPVLYLGHLNEDGANSLPSAERAHAKRPAGIWRRRNPSDFWKDKKTDKKIERMPPKANALFIYYFLKLRVLRGQDCLPFLQFSRRQIHAPQSFLDFRQRFFWEKLSQVRQDFIPDQVDVLAI